MFMWRTIINILNKGFKSLKETERFDNQNPWQSFHFILFKIIFWILNSHVIFLRWISNFYPNNVKSRSN